MAQPTAKTTRRIIRPAASHNGLNRPVELPSSRSVNPALVSDEAAWFDAQANGVSEAELMEKCRQYIRDRFASCLLPEDIERLLKNEKMLEIVTRHWKEFRHAAEANRQRSDTNRGASQDTRNNKQTEPQGKLIPLPPSKNRAA